jgi:hypothetical protein
MSSKTLQSGKRWFGRLGHRFLPWAGTHIGDAWQAGEFGNIDHTFRVHVPDLLCRFELTFKNVDRFCNSRAWELFYDRREFFLSSLNNSPGRCARV